MRGFVLEGKVAASALLVGLALWCQGCSSSSARAGATDASPARDDDAAQRDGEVVADSAGLGVPDATLEASTDASARDSTAPQDSNVTTDSTASSDAGPAYTLLGRFAEDDDAGEGGMRAVWTGSGVYAKFTGTSIAADMASDTTSQYAVFIDGTVAATPLTVTSAARSTQTLADSLAPGVTHELLLFKENEAQEGALVLFGLLPTGGAMVPAALPFAHRLELIGDSITAGYGNLGLGDCANAETTDEGGHESYASIAARQLNADVHIVAYSGHGAYRDYSGDTSADAQMGTWYKAATTTYSGGGAIAVDVPWSFTRWTADAVVVNLGTNDFATGDPGQPFVDAMIALLTFVRTNYPAVPIFVVLSPMLVDPNRTTCQTYLQSVIMALRTSPTDTSIQLVSFPPLTDGTLLCEGHPSLADDGAMAMQLSSAIGAALGWSVDLSVQ